MWFKENELNVRQNFRSVECLEQIQMSMEEVLEISELHRMQREHEIER